MSQGHRHDTRHKVKKNNGQAKVPEMSKNDDSKKRLKELKSGIVADVTQAVNEALSQKMKALDKLITAADIGEEPRLKHVEAVVEKGPDNLVNRIQSLEETVKSLKTLVGPTDQQQLIEGSIQQNLVDLKDLIENVENNPGTGEHGTDFADFQASFDAKCTELNDKMDCHDKAIGVLEHKLVEHDSRITMNLAKHMSDNVKIGGLPEKTGENCMLTVSQFFENIMGLKPGVGDIIEASRLRGTLHRKIKGIFKDYPRLMFVKCSPAFRRMIESRKPVLANKYDEDSRIKYTIRNHLPDSHYAVRIKYNPWVRDIIANNEGKPDSQKETFSFQGDQFYVNGKRVVERVQPPTLAQVCALTTKQKEELDLLKFFESSCHTEKGSKFTAYATTALFIQHIENCYMKLRKDFMTASHISMGYQIDDTESTTPVQGAVSDGEHQADGRLISTMFRSEMNNIAVFVIRRYGGVHIGGTHLTLIQKAAMEAINNLKSIRGDITDISKVTTPDSEDEEDENLT